MATTAIGVAPARRTGMWLGLLILGAAVAAVLLLVLPLESPQDLAPRGAVSITSPEVVRALSWQGETTPDFSPEAGRTYAPAMQAPVFSPEANRTYAPAVQAPAFSPEANRTYAPAGQSETFSPERHRV